VLPRNLSPAARLLSCLSPVATVAQITQHSTRSVFNWRQGRTKPNRKARKICAERLGIPEALWEPAPSTFETQLAAGIAAAVRDALAAAHDRIQQAAK
jgi:alpha-D-ribose 1-methylphosphonate 5-triphosphate synthase subunit PhnL